MNDQIGCAIIAFCLILFSAALISALFSDHSLAQLRWKGSRKRPSRLSIVLILPFVLYHAAMMSTWAVGGEWPWTIPLWAFMLYFAVFTVSHLADRLRKQKG
jgi:hypothetical protein